LESHPTLGQWLKELKQNKPGIVDYEFPTEALREEYLATIEKRSWDDIKALLRKFLLPSCTLPQNDQNLLYWLVNWKPIRKSRPRITEFYRRLILYARLHKAYPNVPPPWEGVTWILDLLPNNPRAALNVLDSYFSAHCLYLPDGRMIGIYDATRVIRAKCIERPRSPEAATQLLLSEPPSTLEHLVERLYSALGYNTTLTPRQKDGGYDVLAEKTVAGQRALLHVECKRWNQNVGVPILRSLLGVVSDSKATNGVCATTSDLTATAKAFVERNPRLDYITGPELVEMFNEHFGPSWYNEIDRLVLESRTSALSVKPSPLGGIA
jgi:restriction system protein